AERAIGEHHQVVALGVRKDVLFDLPLEQIVGRLDGGKRRSLPEAIHLLRRKIADADGANFSLAAKGIERSCRLLERNRRVRPMHLIDVDDVGLEAAKRVLELIAQPRRRGVAQELAASPVKPDLGGDDRTRSPSALKRLADQLLGAAEAIAR